jgi:hypothetical protein
MTLAALARDMKRQGLGLTEIEAKSGNSKLCAFQTAGPAFVSKHRLIS